jgi:hypothetical protein
MTGLVILSGPFNKIAAHLGLATIVEAPAPKVPGGIDLCVPIRAACAVRATGPPPAPAQCASVLHAFWALAGSPRP